jgi:hypothetical protein
MQQGLGGAARPGLLYGTFDLAKAQAAEEARIREAEGRAIAGIDEEIKRYDEFNKNLGRLGEEKEGRLRGSLKDLEGKKGEAKSMALFQAGLAILSADPTRGGLAAIGEGAIKGLGAYKGDLKDLEASRERMLGKLDDLDVLRRQESMASEKGRREITQRRNQTIEAFGKEYRSTMSKFGVDIPLKAAETMAEQASRMNQARIMADRSTGADRLREELRKHKPGSPEYNEILRRESDLSRAQGASREDVAAIRDPNYLKAVDRLNMMKMRRDTNTDPKTADELNELVRRAEADVAAARNRADSTGGAASNAPKIGDVQQGYRFKGGNPADPSNWEKVK